jgi:tetratricopeptide (TPR) repeat protein
MQPAKLNLARLCALLWLSIAGPACGADFNQANELFEQGKFAEAKGAYERLLASGFQTANLFYNLGNADYRLGSPGRAILNYERALALEPSHPEAGSNLTLLRNRSAARVPETRWWERATGSFSQQTLTLGGSIAFWSGAALLVFVLVRRPGGAVVWMLMLLAWLVALSAGAALFLREQNRVLAIITAREAEARVAPADLAKSAGKLPAGSRVRVLSERGGWTYCELPGEGRGWIPAGSLERVYPGAA